MFPAADPPALAGAIRRFESHQDCFDPEWIAWHASQFSTERFCQEFARIVSDLAADSDGARSQAF